MATCKEPARKFKGLNLDFAGTLAAPNWPCSPTITKTCRKLWISALLLQGCRADGLGRLVSEGVEGPPDPKLNGPSQDVLVFTNGLRVFTQRVAMS